MPRRNRAPSHRTPKAREKDGMIEWPHLTEKERLAFKSDFIADAARLARMDAMGWEKSGFDPHVAWALHHYEKARRTPRPIVAEEAVTNRQLNELQQRLGTAIQTALWYSVAFGRWQSLHWLADYGEKHCQEGLWQLLPERNDLPTPCFPDPHSHAARSHDVRYLLASAMLRSFLALTGSDFDLLHLPGLKRTRREMLCPTFPEDIIPARLPTKQRLAAVTLGEWRALTGSKAKAPASHVSRIMRDLGLSGLPKGRPQPLPEGTLSEEALSLRDSMRQA